MQVPNPFDGKPEDYFNRTSMHISFTEWKRSLFVRHLVGTRDIGFQVVEAAVQVRDAGVWVADVNITEALANVCIRRQSDMAPCKHTTTGRSFGDCLPLETWDQVLDNFEGVLVTKSHENWVARLALASVLSQHSKVDCKQIIICPPDGCGACIMENMRSRNVVIID